MTLSIKGLCKGFTGTRVLDQLAMSVAPTELITLTGLSGCGKSTLLKIIAGIESQDQGEIKINGQSANNRIDRRGRFGYMPQQDALLPWRSLLDNVVLGPEIAGRNVGEAKQQAKALLPLFGLAGRENSLPATLSGGMRRRAALLRTWLTGENLMLLDEPFSGLDAFIRYDLQIWLLELQKRLPKTIVFASHDLEEAIRISGRVLVLSGNSGKLIHQEIVERTKTGNQYILKHKKNILTAMKEK